MSLSTSQGNLTHGWVDSPDGRGTFDIIWPCFFAIFTCTFSVLQLNVPAPDEAHTTVLLRKVKWMLFTILVPEIVTTAAFAQYAAAKSAMQAMNNLHEQQKRIDRYRWTMPHAFYWNMGGVWLQLRGIGKPFPINADLHVLLQEHGIVEQPSITGKEISDKSKVDKFAKFLACLQVSWLCVQCGARYIQGLPVSLLEIATIGFAIPSLATYAFWFSKPSDVQTTTIIRSQYNLEEVIACLGTKYNNTVPRKDSPLDPVKAVNQPSATSEFILKTAWWPYRSRFDGRTNRIRNDVFALKYRVIDQFIIFSIWVAYGGVHFAGWHFMFPTRVEALLYRSAVCGMLGSMLMTGVVGNRKTFLIFSCFSRKLKTECHNISNERRQVPTVQRLLGTVVGFVYFAARLCLIAEVLASLRALPKGAFETIVWTKFIPHVA